MTPIRALRMRQTPSGAAAAIIANAVKATGSTTTSVTTASFTSTTGSTFLIWIAQLNAKPTNVPTDTYSNLYILMPGMPENVTGDVGGWLFYCQNGTGGAGHAATCTFGATSDPSIYFIEIANVGAAPIDFAAFAINADTVSPYTVTSGTFAQARNLVLVFCGNGSPSNPATFAESTGFSIVLSETNGALFWPSAFAQKFVTANTALTSSWTVAGGTGSALAIIALKSA